MNESLQHHQLPADHTRALVPEALGSREAVNSVDASGLDEWTHHLRNIRQRKEPSMNMQTELPGTEQKRSRGRKDQDGTTENIKHDSIKKGCSEMMRAFKKFQSAKEDYDDIVKAVAERSNSNVKTLKRLVKASANGNFEDVQRDIEQQAEVFAEVGEIAGGKGTD